MGCEGSDDRLQFSIIGHEHLSGFGSVLRAHDTGGFELAYPSPSFLCKSEVEPLWELTTRRAASANISSILEMSIGPDWPLSESDGGSGR